MKRAGFVLVGGASRRMGRDKALLPFGRFTLVEHVAAQVAAAAGSVTLVGCPSRYARLGHPVIADRFPNAGPLAGIQAALAAGKADLNLVVACDLPALTARLLKRLLAAAEAAGADALVPRWPQGWLEPLCAVYRPELAGSLADALQRGVRKVTDALAGLRVAYWPIRAPGAFENLNTVKDWTSHAARLPAGAP